MSKHTHDIVSVFFVFSGLILILVILMFYFNIINIKPIILNPLSARNLYAGKDPNNNADLYLFPVNGFAESHILRCIYTTKPSKYSLYPDSTIHPDDAPQFHFSVNSNNQVYLSSKDPPIIFNYTNFNFFDNNGNILSKGFSGSNEGSWCYMVKQTTLRNNNWTAITFA